MSLSANRPSEESAPSVADVTKALRQFLEEPNPSIIAITGKWGRGKSFFWRELLRNNVRDEDDRLYSYISLFGLGELQQLKDAVFDNAIPLRGRKRVDGSTEATPLFSPRGLAERAKIVAWHIKKLGSVADKVPTLSDLAPFARALAFLSVRNYVVCIDDLERRGVNLALRDVLGMATLLREQKNCRVIVILNSDALEGDREEYDRLREKVFDYEMVFAPEARACAAIVFPNDDEYYEQAKEHVTTLDITNIRVLFRVRRLLDALLAEGRNAPVGIKRQLVHSAVLLGWCYNTKDGTAPDYGYVKNWNYGRILDRVLGEEPTALQTRWNGLLEAYDYRNTDELDLAICDTLERGYADTRTLTQILANREEADRRSQLEQAFQAAWQIFHGGFGEDEKLLSEAFRASFEAAPELISVMNADTTIRLLRDIGHEALADTMTRHWIDANQRNNPQALNLSENPWRGDVRDPQFRESVETAYAAVVPALPPLSEVAERLGSQNGWSEDDILVLAASSADDYYALFKSLTGSHTRPIARTCLRFASMGGDPRYEVIGTRVRDALIRIAAESPLNANRVRSLGLSLPEAPSQGASAADSVRPQL